MDDETGTHKPQSTTMNKPHEKRRELGAKPAQRYVRTSLIWIVSLDKIRGTK